MSKITYQQRFGVCNGNSKLTPGIAVAIRRALTDGASTREVARRFGVCQTTVMQIKGGVTWQRPST